MNFKTVFSPIVGMMIQSDELIFFRGVETTNQYIFIYIYMYIYIILYHMDRYGSDGTSSTARS